MKTIKVMIRSSDKYVNCFIDNEDYSSFKKFRWFLHKDGYAYRYEYDRRISNNSCILMHRQIMSANKFPGFEIDHINGNRIDNRKSNLRVVKRSHNNQNSKIRRDNKSGFRGVWFDEKTKKWCSSIKLEDKRIWLGRHETPYQAAIAYNQMASKLYGLHAKLNIIQSASTGFRAG